MLQIFNNSWDKFLNAEFKEKYFSELDSYITTERLSYQIYPPESKIFKAFEMTSFENIKIVILGQDPYHGLGQAHGLSFSVPNGSKIPASLRNIYKELYSDLGIIPPKTGNLESWANQGVFLLNTCLTVRANTAGSHQNKGWEIFTDKVISTISNNKEKVVFLLWGKFAQSKANLIDTKKHLVLTAAHPSPLSAYNGFFGCKHFFRIN